MAVKRLIAADQLNTTIIVESALDSMFDFPFLYLASLDVIMIAPREQCAGQRPHPKHSAEDGRLP